MQVPVGLNCGLTGIALWGTDIGGFITTPELTGELYVRWFQYGCFCPLFRSHGRTWKLRLPWGWNTGNLDRRNTTSAAWRCRIAASSTTRPSNRFAGSILSYAIGFCPTPIRRSVRPTTPACR